jgi:hypothetical protein
MSSKRQVHGRTDGVQKLAQTPIITDRPCACSSWIMVVVPQAQAQAESHAAAALSTTTTATAATLASAFVLAARPAALHPRRSLQRDRDAGRHRPQVERLADEVAQRDHQVGRVDRTPGRHVARRLARQAAMFLGAEQQDVGQRRLDRVADAARAVRVGPRPSVD